MFMDPQVTGQRSHAIRRHWFGGIEGSVESSNSCWSVNISAIAHVVWKLGHAKLMMLGDKLHTKNNENTRFLFESRQTTFYIHNLKVYINFQRKKNFLKNHKNQRHYTFNDLLEKNILGVRNALILGFILHLRHDRWITKTMDREYIYISNSLVRRQNVR